MRTSNYANKMLTDPDAGQTESARQFELVTLTSVSATGATATLNRLPAHTVTIDAALFAGHDLKVGDVVLVRATRPDRFGFHGNREPWRATTLEVK